MINTPVIDVAIGLVFCFAATALVASTFTEMVASVLKLRANMLLSGIASMLNDPKLEGLALQIYNHALVHPQGDGKRDGGSGLWTWSGPSYVKSENFARAAVDVFRGVEGGVAGIKDNQVRQLLEGMHARAGTDIALLEKQVASWFDGAMDRVSGGYKRRAQLITFLFGLLLAVTLNIDAAHLTKRLWHDAAVAKTVADRVEAIPEGDQQDPKKLLAGLDALPIGVAELRGCGQGKGEVACVNGHAIEWTGIAGWLITASAAVFGAPFWFDLLQSLIRIRGTGAKPKEPGEKPVA